MKTGFLVCDAMTQRPVYVEHDTAIVECSKIMAKNHISTLVVKKSNKLAGLLTEKDIVRKVVAEDIDPSKILAGEVMETNFPTISPERDIYEAIILMRDKNVRHLPVMSGKSMVGFLTGKDILKLQPQLFEFLAEKIELREWERKETALR
jgi:CBS domain-containing protein